MNYRLSSAVDSSHPCDDSRITFLENYISEDLIDEAADFVLSCSSSRFFPSALILQTFIHKALLVSKSSEIISKCRSVLLTLLVRHPSTSSVLCEVYSSTLCPPDHIDFSEKDAWPVMLSSIRRVIDDKSLADLAYIEFMVQVLKEDFSFRTCGGQKPYIRSLIWPNKSDRRTMFNKSCEDIVSAVLQIACLPQNLLNSKALQCLQKLLSLVLKHQGLKNKMVRCFHLAIVEKFTAQQTHTLLTSMCDAWLVCSVCTEAIDTYDWNVLPHSSCASVDQLLTLKELVSQFLYMQPLLKDQQNN